MPTDQNRIDDPALGILEWQPDTSHWHGSVRLPDGAEADLLVADDDRQGQPVIDEAKRHLASFLRSFPTFRQYAREELLDSAVRNWSADPEFAEREFHRLKVEGIEIIPNLYTKVYLDDSGLFGGHGIIVRLDINGKKVRVSVEG